MADAALTPYTGLPLTLPNGREVVGRVLTLQQALYFAALLAAGQAERPMRVGGRGWWRRGKLLTPFDARAQLIAEFPKAVGLEAELNELTFVEFAVVVADFFERNRATERPETPAAAEPLRAVP